MEELGHANNCFQPCFQARSPEDIRATDRSQPVPDPLFGRLQPDVFQSQQTTTDRREPDRHVDPVLEIRSRSCAFIASKRLLELPEIPWKSNPPARSSSPSHDPYCKQSYQLNIYMLVLFHHNHLQRIQPYPHQTSQNRSLIRDCLICIKVTVGEV